MQKRTCRPFEGWTAGPDVNLKPGLEAAAFDLDGTLYPNHRLYTKLFPFALREWRLLWAFSRARNIIRAEQEQMSTGIHAGYYEYQARLTADIMGADPVVIQEKIERLIYRGWAAYFKHVKLFAHVPETLAALKKAGLKMGLLSDFPPEAKLDYLGIGGLWDAVLCSERTGALKPHPRSFEELTAALGCAPERIIYVGNSRRYDVAGAKRMGMRTALIAGPFPRAGGNRERASVPDFTFHDYRQLYRYVVY
jgi:putative hydrolase of the HAD superfamily